MLDYDIFRQKVLNLYLNADFIPFSHLMFIYGKHSYLGYMPNLGLYPKAAVFDFDGVFELPGTLYSYRLFIKNLFRENWKLRLREADIDSCINSMESTGDIGKGEMGLAKIYFESELTKGQCERARDQTVKDFRFVRNGRRCVNRIKFQLGYVPAIISGSPQLVLEPLAKMVEIDVSNVYASEFKFDGLERFTGMYLRLNSRKVLAQDIYLQKFVNSMYGCRFFFTDEISDVSAAKLGLNPAVFLGEFKREMVPMDVFACCLEARENMLNLIPLMYKFELGYILANTRTKEEEERISELAIGVREIAREAFALKSTDFYICKKSFISRAVDLYTANERYIDKKYYIKQQILRLMFSTNEENDKELMAEIAQFFRNYVAESHAAREWLEDFR